MSFHKKETEKIELVVRPEVHQNLRAHPTLDWSWLKNNHGLLHRQGTPLQAGLQQCPTGVLHHQWHGHGIPQESCAKDVPGIAIRRFICLHRILLKFYRDKLICNVINKRTLKNNWLQLLGMFQNNLSSLSVAEIQQFLDEQTFREIYGQYPLMAFNNIIKKISAQVWSLAWIFYIHIVLAKIAFKRFAWRASLLDAGVWI